MTRTRHPVARPDLSSRERARVLEALREGGVSSLGRHVEEFERAFAARCAVPHAVSTCTGTAALHLAFVALGIGPGDEVVVPDLTFVATANAVAYTGARVVLADVEPESWTLAPEAVARALSPRTRAIVAVHLYGVPPRLGELARLARRHGVALVEDAAEALGARWRGRPVGAVGALSTFSFYGNKVLTTGEGGMVLARSARLDRRLRQLRDHGMSPTRRYWHDRLAFNYRMAALQAALGLGQLERLDLMLERRARIAAWYREELASLPGVREPGPPPGATPVCWLHTVQVEGWTRRRRDAAIAALRRRGVDSRPVFVPMSRLPMYRTAPRPVAAAIAARGISLPTHGGLRRRDVAEIGRAFRRVLAQV
jgi:perosamine synthetase